MGSDVFVKAYIDQNLCILKEQIMSELSDAIADLKVTLDEALVRVQEDVDALNAQVADLNDKIAKGTATPADMAAIADLKARLAALDPTKDATLPEGETPPAPLP